MSNLDLHLGAYAGGSIYDFDNKILLNWYPHRVKSLSPNAKSILELGLGHGFTTRIFADQYDRHLVLDGSTAVIENFRASNLNCKAEIKEVNFEDFDSDEGFDVVMLGFVLEHVDDPVGILRQYKKFVAPKGKLFVAVPNAEVLNRRLGYLAGMLPAITQLSDNDKLLGHKRYYTVSSLKADIQAAGLGVVRMEGIYLKPLATSQLISLNLDPRLIDAFCKVGIEYPELSCGLLAELSV